jgi:hypothetical protein
MNHAWTAPAPAKLGGIEEGFLVTGLFSIRPDDATSPLLTHTLQTPAGCVAPAKMRLRIGLFWSLIFAWLVVVAGLGIPGGVRRVIGAWFTGAGVQVPSQSGGLHQQQEEMAATDKEYDGGMEKFTRRRSREAQFGPEFVRRQLTTTQCLSGQRCSNTPLAPVGTTGPSVASVAGCESYCVDTLGAAYFNFKINTACQCYAATHECTAFQVNADFDVYAIDPVSRERQTLFQFL